jgi:hypothetical protein
MKLRCASRARCLTVRSSRDDRNWRSTSVGPACASQVVETVLVVCIRCAWNFDRPKKRSLSGTVIFPLLLSTVPQGILDDETGCQRRTQFLLTQSLCFREDESDSDSSSRCAFSS